VEPFKTDLGAEPRARNYRDALVAAAYILLMFAGLPYLPIFWDHLARISPLLFAAFSTLLIPVIAVSAFGYLLFRGRRRSPAHLLLTGGICLLFVVVIYNISTVPADRFHIVEYVILSILVFRALDGRIPPYLVYPGVIVCAFMVGVLDEAVQAVIPNRVYDPIDILVNWLSSLFGIYLLSCINPNNSDK
jgi:hypothetical protein